MTSHAGLAISLDPVEPTPEEFWDGQVALSVMGLAEHQVTAEFKLYNAGGNELLAKPIANFDLPITPAEWKTRLSAFVEDAALAWTFAGATSGKFLLKGNEFGEYALRLERDAKPLRGTCPNLSISAGTGQPLLELMAMSESIHAGSLFPARAVVKMQRSGAPLRFKPGRYPIGFALRTVGEALAKAVSQLLEIEPGELMAEYRPSLTPEGR